MRRRDFIKVVAVSTTWPLVAHAQQPAMKRVGIVTIQSPTSPPYATFSQRLRELGYVEGQDLSLDFINPERQHGGNAGAVQELIRRKVDIVLAIYQPTIEAVVAAAPGMPVVMIAIDYDPLALGYIKSLARPGREVTGLYLQQIDLAKKRVELLTQALPNVHAATVIWDSASEDQWKATSSAAIGVRTAACRCAIARPAL
jgi:putative ABC transport system substrate-binding protein